MYTIHKNIYWSLIYVYVAISTSLFADNHQWTWHYVDILNKDDQSSMHYVTPDHNIVPFTQLIFCWNAQRPQKGYFTFLVQARDAQTKKWSSWHKAIEWGHHKQLSYKSPSDGIASYEHVRFEVQQGKKCDAYHICVQAHEGADLRYFNRIVTSCSDFTYFAEENPCTYKNLKTVHINRVPYRSQFKLIHPEKNRLCSPTSCAMLVEFLTKRHVAMPTFSSAVYDSCLDTYGNWLFNMAHSYVCAIPHASFIVKRLNSFKELHSYLMQGLPVAVSVRGVLEGAPQSYNNGHLLVVVGFNTKTQQVLCHDPAFKSNRLTMHAYDLRHFLQAWERSRRLAYCIERHS